jgi:hypothetical protein
MLPDTSRPAVGGAVRQLRSKARFGAARQGHCAASLSGVRFSSCGRARIIAEELDQGRLTQFHARRGRAVPLLHARSITPSPIGDPASIPRGDEVGGGGLIRNALSRSGPSRPSAVNTDEWRALSSHFGRCPFFTCPVYHVEQGEGSMTVTGTPQKVPAGHWISRANPTS